MCTHRLEIGIHSRAGSDQHPSFIRVGIGSTRASESGPLPGRFGCTARRAPSDSGWSESLPSRFRVANAGSGGLAARTQARTACQCMQAAPRPCSDDARRRRCLLRRGPLARVWGEVRRASTVNGGGRRRCKHQHAAPGPALASRCRPPHSRCSDPPARRASGRAGGLGRAGTAGLAGRGRACTVAPLCGTHEEPGQV
jgi:hypothetical protein